MAYRYEYPRPALTVDCVVFGYEPSQTQLQLLLIKRGNPPFVGRWALPGGFVNVGEDLEAAALRELEEETGAREVYLEQLYTFGAPDRDPREHVVSVAYFALVRPELLTIQAGDDAADSAWHPIDQLPELAFDHEAVIQKALARLRGKVRYQPIGFELLPQAFTMPELHRFYEAVLARPVDRRNFTRKLLAMGVLEATGDYGSHKAKRYRFDESRYQESVSQGWNFEI